MKRIVFLIFAVAGFVHILSACATPPTYSAREIRGQVIDAETGQPIEGVVIVAQWVLFHSGIGHGGHKSRLHIHETVSDKNGNYAIPEWGPKLRPPTTELHSRDPDILIFKSGYEPATLTNQTTRADSVRVSEWDGKVVKLARTKRNVEEQAFRLSSFYGTLESVGSSKDWRNYPKMLLAVYAEKRRLQLLGLPPGYAASVPNIERFDEADNIYLRRLER